MSSQEEVARQHAERRADWDGTREWLENARAERRAECDSSKASTLLEEFARLGVLPSNGRRVPMMSKGGGE